MSCADEVFGKGNGHKLAMLPPRQPAPQENRQASG